MNQEMRVQKILLNKLLRRSNLGLLIFLFLLFWPQVSLALEYFVSPKGSDENPGTFAKPWRTVNYGIQELSSGDILTVREGTYTENISAKSGKIGNVLMVRNYTGETPIVNGYIGVISVSYFKIVGIIQQNSSGSGVIIKNSDHITFEDCTIRNNPIHGAFLVRDTTINQYITFTNSILHGNGTSGIRAAPDSHILNAKYITIENCEIYNNIEDGINLANCHNVEILRNKIYNQTTEDGIDIKQVSDYTTITDNEVYGNKQAGIMINVAHVDENPPFSGGTNVIIRRNLVYDNKGHGIRLNSKGLGGYFYIDHNLVKQIAGADAIYLFRGTDVEIYNNTIVGGDRGIVGSCLKDSVILNNIAVDSATTALHFQVSSRDCTGYLNGNIIEGYNNWRSLGDYIITWIGGKKYKDSQLSDYRSDTGQGLNTVSVSPGFSDNVSFKLANGSRLINKGVIISGITTSYHGTQPDLGYSEFLEEPQNLVPLPPLSFRVLIK